MASIFGLGLTNIALTEHDDGVLVATLNRPAKRNALDAASVEDLVRLFDTAPRAGVRSIVLAAAGDHFCAGLDLVEHHGADRCPAAFWQLCLRWHEAFNKMEYGGVPVIAALKGAVVGGGLELASSAHIRVADATTYFALPEGQRGLFTGGGATIRVAGLVGKARMLDMMLTGRVYQGQEAVDVGLCQYLVAGSSLDRAIGDRPCCGPQSAADQLRDLLGDQPCAEHVGDGCVLHGGRRRRHRQHPTRRPRTPRRLRRQDRRAGQAERGVTGTGEGGGFTPPHPRGIFDLVGFGLRRPRIPAP